MPEAEIVLALKLSLGMGNVSINRLTDWTRATERTLEELIHQPLQDLLTLMPQDLAQSAQALSACPDSLLARAHTLIQRFEYTGGQVILSSDDDYPTSLHGSLATAAPPILFVSGDLQLLQGDCAAVAGTRTPSATGTYLAQACARTFAEEQIAVVSGGAAGVDATAHATALQAGGRTIVVLPEGLLSYRGARELLEGVEEGSVVLISEFEPDAKWSTPRALTRNATLVALSRIACVIEPKETGGSIRTAHHALDQGKPLLTYTHRDANHILKQLQRKGAQPFSDNGSDFDRQQLLTAYAQASESTASQSELF